MKCKNLRIPTFRLFDKNEQKDRHTPSSISRDHGLLLNFVRMYKSHILIISSRFDMTSSNLHTSSSLFSINAILTWKSNLLYFLCIFYTTFHLVFHSVESGSYCQWLNWTLFTNNTLIVGSWLSKCLIQAPL